MAILGKGVHFNNWARRGIIEGREKRGGKRDEQKRERNKRGAEREAEAVIDELLAWEEEVEGPIFLDGEASVAQISVHQYLTDQAV